MTKKEKFIEEVTNAFNNIPNFTLSDDALVYFEALKGGADKEKKTFTDNGKIVIQFMQNNKDNYSNLFQAKSIGEGAGISSRTASGALRKLVNDGYVEKLGENPVSYSLTDAGISVDVNAE